MFMQPISLTYSTDHVVLEPREKVHRLEPCRELRIE
nr:MAG TPA: hypothetical protein [Caudoviricetes sp.]